MDNAETTNRQEAILVPDDLLPDTEHGKMGLRDTLSRGGWAICSLAVPLVAMEQLSREASTTLAPEIQNYFGVSDAMLIAITGFSGVTLTLGGLPMAWLADRIRRKYLVIGSATLGTIALIGAGLAQNATQLFVAYALTGIAAAYSNPVFGSMISDAYPVEGRGRIFSMHAMATPLGQAIGPALAGSIAGLAGGAEAWRWAYLGLALPYALLAISAAIFLKEPVRGQSERVSMTGGDVERAEADRQRPHGTIAAFRRMMKVKTFLFVCLGIGVLGLALFTVPIQISLLLGDEYRLDAVTRGTMFSLTQIPVIAGMIIGGHQFDRMYRKQPERTMHIAGSALIAFGALMVIGIWFQPIWAVWTFYVLAMMCSGIALVAVSPLVATVTPYRLRAQAFAILPVFTFLMGGFFGAIFAGFISDSYGPRMALSIAVPFSAFLAGYLVLHGARYLKRDISAAVQELLSDIQDKAEPPGDASAAKTP